MKEDGNKIQCMDMEFILGMMEESMKDNMWWIKNKDTVNIFGQMGKYIKENGKMVSKMEKENYIIDKK